eukprot:14873006-Alexandrium_andersonii.AAC.1
MTVWARALRRLCPAAIPRALADDLLVAVHAEGPDESDTVLEDHTSAVSTTIGLLHAMGARLSPK